MPTILPDITELKKATTVQCQEEETLEQLHHRVTTHTQALKGKVSDHSAVHQTYNNGLAALKKRKEEGHAGLDEERADLERKLVTVKTCRHTLDTEITTEQTTLTTWFDADTAEYNHMNTDLVTSERQCGR